MPKGRNRRAKTPSVNTDKLRTVFYFISTSGSGQSIVSSLLDAHKHIMSAREACTFRSFDRCEKDLILLRMTRRSQWYCKTKKMWHYGSNMSHMVEGYSNGTADPLYALGDKCGISTSKVVQRNGSEYLTRAEDKLGLPLKFIFVHREPLDVIAHCWKHREQWGRKRPKGLDLEKCFKMATGWINMSERAASIVNDWNPNRLHCVKHEDFVNNFRDCFSGILRFLGVANYRGYLRACASMIRPELMNERIEASWTADLLSKVAARSPLFKI